MALMMDMKGSPSRKSRMITKIPYTWGVNRTCWKWTDRMPKKLLWRKAVMKILSYKK